MDYTFQPESGASSAPDLIPAGVLTYALVTIGAAKQAKESGGTYYPLTLTLMGGQYEGRKIFETIPDVTDTKNSEKWRAIAVTNMIRMFEVAGVFNPANPESYRALQGKPFLTLCNFLDGKRIAIRIKIEKSSDPAYADKNKVGEYLSTNPTSQGYKNYVKLLGGQSVVAEARSNAFSAPVAQAPATAPGWIKLPAQAAPNTDTPF
jgi:hypothetical protein